MDYKLELQNNNIDLSMILESINALPDASVGEGVDTSDATATAENITAGATAYVNGEKIVGTMVVKSFRISDSEPDNSMGEDGDLYLVKG